MQPQSHKVERSVETLQSGEQNALQVRYILYKEGKGLLLSVNACTAPYRGVIFGGQNTRGSAILRHFVSNIFVVGACTAGKGRQGRFIRGHTSNHENVAPTKLPSTRYKVGDTKLKGMNRLASCNFSTQYRPFSN